MSKLDSKRYFIETYGCAANKSDSERILRILNDNHWQSIEDPLKADLVIINTCGVKDPTERKILRQLSEYEKLQPLTTVVTGCLPNMSLKSIKKVHPRFGAIIDTKSTHLFSTILKRLEHGESQIELFAPTRNTALGKLEILPLPMNPLIGILTINEGCDGNCTFCGTKLARGKTLAHSPQGLLTQAENLLQNGAKELWITSQDSGAYYYESKNNVWELPELLDKICQLPYRFRVRLGMINPDHMIRLQLKRNQNRLLDVMAKHSQIFSFLHIPVQSGNDRILQLMKRRYSNRDFKKLITKIKEKFPKITLSTDIIVGFPSETENDFLDTLDLIKWLKPPVLNVSRYGIRPGTVAARMGDQIHPRISKERSRLIAKTWEPIAYEENQKWIGWQGQVLIDEKGKLLNQKLVNQNQFQVSVIARNWAYKPVVLKGNIPLGLSISVKIAGAKTHYLSGELLDDVAIDNNTTILL